MKKFYATILFALVSLTAFAQETNDTTYVMMNFTTNPWNYAVREVTSGWQPVYTDWDSPGAILTDTDFSWAMGGGSPDKIKVTLYAVDLDEYNKVSVFSHYVVTDADAASLGVENTSVNILYTQNGTRMRFQSPEGYKFGKMVFYNYRSSNFLVGDEYEEEHTYIYNNDEFKQKLKFWVPTSPKKNAYDIDIWEGDETNVLFNYPYFNAHFVKIDIRLVPGGSSGINNLRADSKDAEKTYTLDGREVNKANGLPKGVYIKDGKKVIVK